MIKKNRKDGKYRSRLSAAIHETAAGLHRIGLMDKGQLLMLETPENFLKSKNDLALAYIETLGLALANQNPVEGRA